MFGQVSGLHLEVSSTTQLFALLPGVSFGTFTGPGYTGLTVIQVSVLVGDKTNRYSNQFSLGFIGSVSTDLIPDGY